MACFISLGTSDTWSVATQSHVVAVHRTKSTNRRQITAAGDARARHNFLWLSAAWGVGTHFLFRLHSRRRAQRHQKSSLLHRGHLQRHALGGWPSSYVSSNNSEELLRTVQWPAAWPYTSEDFSRADESEDTFFYSEPRLCTHVDDNFIARLRSHYEKVFTTYEGPRILDICSSWISHYPEKKCWSHVSITGMNKYELQQNKQADDYTVRNLNTTPELQYENCSFDIVTCTVSFDYLNKPLEVMKEVARVLKPGGTIILSTSNRCFPTKAINLWVRTGDMEHILIYGSYIHYTGEFEAPEAVDLSSPMAKVGFADPVYIIQARKK